MKKMYLKKIIVVIMFISFFVSIVSSTSVFADSSETTGVNEMWSRASSWFGKIETANNSQQAVSIVSEFSSIINVIGTTVIVIATEVKESLITLLIACIFFFGWQGISAILIPGGRLVWSNVNDASYKNLVGRVFSSIVFILNIATIAAIIYVGVRYIFSGASGKADLKARSPYFFIGIIMAFCSVSFLTFVSNVINDMF